MRKSRTENHDVIFHNILHIDNNVRNIEMSSCIKILIIIIIIAVIIFTLSRVKISQPARGDLSRVNLG